MKEKIRIGSGAGYAGDRLEPALTLMEEGNLDYIGFECLAERTIALAQLEKKRDPTKGYNHLLEYRMEQVQPLAYRKGIKVLTNMGAANPEAALDVCAKMAERQGLKGMRLAAVLGDDLFPDIERYLDLPMLETGEPLSVLGGRICSANAYLGAGPLVQALRQKANIVITGRVADPALLLAPLIQAYNWPMDDWVRLGRGTMVGHLLECAGQLTGGYFADPLHKPVPELWNLGFPYAEVSEDGNGMVGKVKGTGGCVTRSTCTEQLLYEIHDPARYYTPDCAADFSKVTFEEKEKDQVSFSGASGAAATATYKVSVGYQNGFWGEGEISYSGNGCVQRAQWAAEIVKKRLSQMDTAITDLRTDLIGINAVFPQKQMPLQEPQEVRLRIAGRTQDRSTAQKIANEVEALYTNGPYGGGGATKKVEEVISVASILVPKSQVDAQVRYLFQDVK